MWYVYIIECCDKTLYTGIAKDIPKRLKSHNSKRGSAYTRTRTPVKLVYQESCPTRSLALKREFRIKGLKRQKKLSLIGLKPSL